ncbi:MAG: hypothetical protein IMZ58_07565 [Thermoplasmata archaeon]|nr:hypothetical protein [Thermoplasmata archaeon]
MWGPLTKEKEMFKYESKKWFSDSDIRSAIEGFDKDIEKFYLDNAGMISLEQIRFLKDKWFPVFKEPKKP